MDMWQQLTYFFKLNKPTPHNNNVLLPHIDNLSTFDLSSTHDLVTFYNKSFSSILNSVALLGTKSDSLSCSGSRFTSELCSINAPDFRLKQLQKKSSLTVHKALYKSHFLQYKRSITETKSSNYFEIIRSNMDNLLILFSLLSSAVSIFAEFSPPYLFSVFFSLSAVDISDIIHQSKPSTCQPDPFPTVLVKSYLISLLPIITDIIHSLFSFGTVPTAFRSAAIAVNLTLI